MNQEPVLIKGVVAFPNPNGNREIRFIDAFYHDLFKISYPKVIVYGKINLENLCLLDRSGGSGRRIFRMADAEKCQNL